MGSPRVTRDRPDPAAVTAETLAARFKGPMIRTRRGFHVCCVVHEDRVPSLAIDEGKDGRLLIYCRAGCSTESVLAAVGLTFADLWPGGPHRLGPRPTPRTPLVELLAHERRAQARRAPYHSAYTLADRVRDGERTVLLLRERVSGAGDTETGWDLAVAAAAVEEEVRLDEVEWMRLLTTAVTQPRRGSSGG